MGMQDSFCVLPNWVSVNCLVVSLQYGGECVLGHLFIGKD